MLTPATAPRVRVMHANDITSVPVFQVHKSIIYFSHPGAVTAPEGVATPNFELPELPKLEISDVELPKLESLSVANGEINV